MRPCLQYIPNLRYLVVRYTLHQPALTGKNLDVKSRCNGTILKKWCFSHYNCNLNRNIFLICSKDGGYRLVVYQHVCQAKQINRHAYSNNKSSAAV